MTEAEIIRAMKALDLTREEAIEMLREDEEIDRGGNPRPLTAEQEKASKAARIVSTGPRTAPVKRERKPNEDKRFIIDKIVECILYDVDKCKGTMIVDIENPERQIEFTYHDVRYRVVLSAPRK